MNIKSIKKQINHDALVFEGWKLSGIQKGFFKDGETTIQTPVLRYTKPNYVNVGSVSIELRDRERFYNRFGVV
ncbi:MAG TPA: hypothetical protein ACFYD4_14560 [Candidatus Wunengus sp. YC61]|uniref:hypothetical protein n=1 Tax=Candidatus Wunengus sp. YC61 TaxID=3367698 RepID=UPI004029C86F